jgi:serine phosphatase RsbU (regulator of sigma subunit)/tetratricopeptide (TPR) repeat protein
LSLLGHLNTLESAGLVRIAQLEPDLEYLFRHALVREAAYSSILSSDQKRLHLAVGEAIEQLYPEKLAEYAAMLAYHFGAAGEARKAMKYCSLAGEAALSSYANQEAESHFRCALGMVMRKPERANLLYLLGVALFRQSRYPEAIQIWHEGIQFYLELGNYEGVARLYARSARASWYAGDQPEGLRLSQEGLQAVEGMAESPAKAMLIHEASRAYFFNGYPEEAETLCRQALEMAERQHASDTQADALTTLGVLPGITAEEALKSLEQAVELAESNGYLGIAARANHNFGVVIEEQLGEQKDARRHFLRAAEIARDRGAAHEELFSFVSAAYISLGLGDIKTAEEILRNIWEIERTLSDPDQALLSIQGIEISLKILEGNLTEALEGLRKIRSEARQRGDLQMLFGLSMSITEIYLIQDHIQKFDDWSEAEQASEEAIWISKRGVGSAIWALCFSCRMNIRQGKLAEAEQRFSQAQEKAGSAPSFWQKQALIEAERDLAAAHRRWVQALTAAEAASKRLALHETRWPWANSLVEWAGIHLARGDANDQERAWALYREAAALYQEMETEFYANLIDERLRALRAKSYAVALEHDKVTQELLQAGRVQETFLPEEIPAIDGWDISAALQPAHETSGDFYDFIQLPGDLLGIVVADVADKGMGAALYMATCRTLIRTYAGEHPDQPEQVLAKVNRRILADTHAGLFTTVFYGVLDPASGRMRYCNAGHNPPLLFSPGLQEDHQVLSRTGMPLGVLEEASWAQEMITIKDGEVLVAYTDGVTEIQNEDNEFYGEGRLSEAVRLNLKQPAQDLLQSLQQEIHQFSGGLPQLDDLTLLVVKRN